MIGASTSKSRTTVRIFTIYRFTPLVRGRNDVDSAPLHCPHMGSASPSLDKHSFGIWNDQQRVFVSKMHAVCGIWQKPSATSVTSEISKFRREMILPTMSDV